MTGPQIIDFCLGAIATYRVTHYVRFVAEWSMSGTKVKKFELQIALTAELDGSGIARLRGFGFPHPAID